MIEHQIVNVIPMLVDGHLFSMKFTVLGIDLAADIQEATHFNTPASLPDRIEPYAQADFLELAGSIAMAQGLYTELDARIEAKKAGMLPPDAQLPMEPDPVKQRAAWVKEVDNYIGKITDQYTRFTLAYTMREAAAHAYKESGYTIEPDELITRFADNVKIPYPTATEIILGQATKLRKAVKDLDNLRMDKYRISGAETQELAGAEYGRIIRAADAIAETL